MVADNTQYKKIGQKVVNINGLTLNKQPSKLKVWCFKSPTFHIATVTKYKVSDLGYEY